MTSRGLHRLLGGKYEHTRPECGTCRFRISATAREVPLGFVDRCLAKDRVLCCPVKRKTTCRDFEPLARARGEEG